MRKVLGLAFLACACLSQAVTLDDFSDGNMTDTITSGSNFIFNAATVPGGLRGVFHRIDGNDFNLSHTATVTSGIFSSAAKSGVDPYVQIAYGFDNQLANVDMNLDLSAYSAFCFTVLVN